MTSYFQSKGYFDVKVTADLNRQPNVISLVYRIEQGPRHKVENVTVSGNRHFSDQELLSRAAVHKARLFSHGNYSEQLLRRTVSSITDLYRAAGYGQAKVVPHVTTSNGNLVISLAVQEGPRDIVDEFATARQHERAAKSIGAERASTRAR